MITVTEARQLIREQCNRVKVDWLPVAEAGGSVLAETVLSLTDTPPFDQSAMDGYAFLFDGWDGISELKIAGEIPAGSFPAVRLNASETIRIYTGAPLPKGADTVVIQEKVIIKNNTVIIQDEQLVKGRNVRLQGSQTKKGEVAMRPGQLITPAAISFLCGMGIDKVKVYAKPVVSIIVTGNELVKPGETIGKGKIFESNSSGLAAALGQVKISPVSVDVVDDDAEAIKKAITLQLQSDIIILTGGISVGDHDLVEASLEACGAIKIFHKVKQKPGKPLYFGMIGNTLVFALPGNPASVLMCFYEYIVPVISHFTKQDHFKRSMMPLADDYIKRPGFTYFLNGKTEDGFVKVLGNQESYKMNSFAIADCLVELEEKKESYKKGDMVRVNMII